MLGAGDSVGWHLLAGLADAINAYLAAALIVLTITTLLIAVNLFTEHTLLSSLLCCRGDGVHYSWV